MSAQEHRGPSQWVGLALGLPLMAIGVRGVLVNADRTNPPELARWLVGSAIVHDLVVLPFVLVVAVAARRVVPAVAWPPVRWALATTGIVLVLSWPFVRGYGQRPANPSLLPRSYLEGTLVAIAIVWLLAALWIGWSLRTADMGDRSVREDVDPPTDGGDGEQQDP